MAKTVKELGIAAKAAAKEINTATTKTKNSILSAIADGLRANIDVIVKANEEDLKAGRENGLKESFIDRLTLTPQRVQAIADAVDDVVRLPDPVGRVVGGSVHPNGMRIQKTKVPLGTIGMIFESRPNVTVDAAVLCIKSGNGVILRGGKEAIRSNMALTAIMREAIASCGVNPDIVCLVEDTDRRTAVELMQLKGYIDVIIPRGGAGLIQSVMENATVPAIETGVGNCHIFVDESADFDMAVSIIDNAKTQRPSVCNSVETVLIHEAVAEEFLPLMKKALDGHNTELRGCEKTEAILGDCVIPVTEDDYYTEFNDYILAVRVVKDIDEAIAHIDKYSSHHTEAILTRDFANSQYFIKMLDAAAIFVNASTRFVDGGEFGLGAEIGISTHKLHARGPMGLEELTTDKFVVLGEGQIR